MAKTEKLNMKELAGQRSSIYGFLAAVYRQELTSELLRQMKDRRFQEVLSNLGVKLNNGFFQNSEKELLENLAIEYTRLFRGLKREYSPPPPYESVYREEDVRTFGEVTAVVRNQYRRHGFDVAPELTNEPSDHISIELEFMHLLCTREAEALKAKDDEAASDLRLAQREFLDEHLMAWTSSLRQEVEKFDGGGLFTGLLRFTEGWLAFDYRNHVAGA